MSIPIKKFQIRKNRLAASYKKGLSITREGTLFLERNKEHHVLFLGHINCNEEGALWGRFCMKTELPDNSAVIVRAFATDELYVEYYGELITYDDLFLNPKLTDREKFEVFESFGGTKKINASDLLLYEQKGRYLFISIEIIGEGDGCLENLIVYQEGDNFMQTFPEVYQEEGGFFHRYLSIFSSLYMDFQQRIEHIHEVVDIDTAPAEYLPLFAKWVGINIEGNFLTEKQLRELLKRSVTLSKLKGTQEAIKQLADIFLEDAILIVEKTAYQSYIRGEDRKIYDNLYGTNPYGFTILINRESDEKLKAQLMFLLNQFKPVRSRINLVFLNDGYSMDSYCYLDINARVYTTKKGLLDGNRIMNGSAYLQ